MRQAVVLWLASMIALSGTGPGYCGPRENEEAIGAADEAGADKPVVLFVGKERDHPYRTHEYMTGCRLLAKYVEKNAPVRAVVSKDWPRDLKGLDAVRSIVLYTAHGGDVLLRGRARESARKLLTRGVGLTAIHWSTSADPAVGEEWLNALGGWFHPSFAQYPVRESALDPVDPRHPISRGWERFDMRDEYYVNLKHHPASIPLWVARFDGKENVVAWTFERADGGRSFGTVCGHFWNNFGDERFRRALVNGILWTAKFEIPPNGADVRIGPEDLDVPPEGKNE